MKKEEDTVENLRHSAHNLGNAAHQTAKEASRDLRDSAYDAGRKARGLLDTATSEFGNIGENLKSELHKNPGRSSAIALGIGLVLGLFLSR
jgi:ElaB/YqjD/DUF883 family membrane-anchored ribosome-binding protein